MKQTKPIHIAWYVLSDFLTASLAWGIMYFLRKYYLGLTVSEDGELAIDDNFWLGITLVPAGWLILYALVGSYKSLYKKSKLREVTITHALQPTRSISSSASWNCGLLPNATSTRDYKRCSERTARWTS
jgi:hypothetical protein